MMYPKHPSGSVRDTFVLQSHLWLQLKFNVHVHVELQRTRAPATS